MAEIYVFTSFPMRAFQGHPHNELLQIANVVAHSMCDLLPIQKTVFVWLRDGP